MPIDKEKLEEVCQDIGYTLGKVLARRFGERKVGFCLLMFDFGEGGHMTYMSSGDRADMIDALGEFQRFLQTGQSGVVRPN